MTDFTGRGVLITGGAGGIGAETARAFLEQGAKVALVDISEQALATAKAELDALGEVITIAANVTDEADVQRYVAETVTAFGRIDVFFNNAGIEGRMGPFTSLSVEDFDRTFAINAKGVFLGLKHVVPVMQQAGGGSIINTSSEAGLDGSPNVLAYIGSKHAVTGITKAAALEVAGTGVRINSVHPSGVNTAMVKRIAEGFAGPDGDPDSFDFAAAIPAGRLAKPRDIANVVVFLGSDEAEFVTGAQWRVDGGVGAR